MVWGNFSGRSANCSNGEGKSKSLVYVSFFDSRVQKKTSVAPFCKHPSNDRVILGRCFENPHGLNEHNIFFASHYHTSQSGGSFLMSYEHEPVSPMFRIDVSADSKSGKASAETNAGDLLRQLVEGQKQQNLLLEELLHQQVAANRQRATELQQWKNANPELARSCRRAAETLSQVQTQFLNSMTDEIEDSQEYLLEGDYMLNEFVDRFGPRLAHLNGVLQVLAQLGGEPSED